MFKERNVDVYIKAYTIFILKKIGFFYEAYMDII